MENVMRTPEPWLYEYGTIVSPVFGRIAMADRGNPRIPPTERDANVRLMSYALELYKQLQALASVMEEMHGQHESSADPCEYCEAMRKANDLIYRIDGVISPAKENK